MDISPHLSLAEYLATAHRPLVAEQLRAWQANPALWMNARHLAFDVFEPVRALLGAPLHVTSGFRCVALNRAVGGRPTSRHVFALAVDVVPIGIEVEEAFATIALAVRELHLPHVDEAIREMGWIHVQAAADGEPRHAVLVTDDGAHFQTWV